MTRSSDLACCRIHFSCAGIIGEEECHTNPEEYGLLLISRGFSFLTVSFLIDWCLLTFLNLKFHGQDNYMDLRQLSIMCIYLLCPQKRGLVQDTSLQQQNSHFQLHSLEALLGITSLRLVIWQKTFLRAQISHCHRVTINDLPRSLCRVF